MEWKLISFFSLALMQMQPAPDFYFIRPYSTHTNPCPRLWNPSYVCMDVRCMFTMRHMISTSLTANRHSLQALKKWFLMNTSTPLVIQRYNNELKKIFCNRSEALIGAKIYLILRECGTFRVRCGNVQKNSRRKKCWSCNTSKVKENWKAIFEIKLKYSVWVFLMLFWQSG